MAMFDEQGKQSGENLFGQAPLQQEQTPKRKDESAAYPAHELAEQIGGLSRRLKMLEDRSANLTRREQLTDQNLIEGTKKIHAEMRSHTDELQELRQKLHEIEEKIGLIIREFQNVPRKEDMKVLEKYVTLWNPMDFITRTQVERIVAELMEKRSGRQRSPKEGQE